MSDEQIRQDAIAHVIEEMRNYALVMPATDGRIVQAWAEQLAAISAAEGWRSIESAPTDGTEILLTDGYWKRTGYWASRRGVWSVDTVVPLNPPTHWCQLRPLPLSPHAQRETTEQ
jgi:hypothetical protein